MRKYLAIGVFAVVVVLTAPKVASAWGLPPTPPGCTNWGDWLLTGGGCQIH